MLTRRGARESLREAEPAFDSQPDTEFHQTMRNAGAFPFLDEALGRRLTALGVALSDVAERFIRGSGPGGQKINKSSSAVWLLHRPTHITVRCQRERSQAFNREQAWTELAAKLETRKREAEALVQTEREAARRRTRQKSRAQKARMLENKKLRSRRKSLRSRMPWD